MSVNSAPEVLDEGRDARLQERVGLLLERSTEFAAVVDSAINSADVGVNGHGSVNNVSASDWRANRALFVTGPHASGKSAVVRAGLSPDDGFAAVDTGPTLRAYHQRDAPKTPFGQWIGENEEEYGTNFTDELLTGHIRAVALGGMVNHALGIVVIGNRSFGGVTYLQRTVEPSDSRLVYVDAPTGMMYERYKTREGKSDITPAEFEALLEVDLRIGLGSIVSRADLTMLNDGELASAARQLREYVDDWRQPVAQA